MKGHVKVYDDKGKAVDVTVVEDNEYTHKELEESGNYRVSVEFS